MAYATVQDLILRFGERKLIQLTDRAEPPAGMVDEQVALSALTYASTIIDGHVAVHYTLPLSGVHPLLNELTLDIAWWRLFSEPTDEAVKRYEAATSALSRISRGLIKLTGEGGSTPPARDGAIIIESQDRLFSRDRMSGF